MQLAFYILMFVLGAAFGSFLCCEARRLRERELHHKKLPARSVCLHCHKKLKTTDNIPLISWLILKGKCRHCHQKIGRLEFLSELGLALAFMALSISFVNNAIASTSVNLATFPAIPLLNWVTFITTLLLTLSLGFLAIYDGMCGELPSLALTISAICAIIVTILQQWTSVSVAGFSWTAIALPIASASILGGLYLLLYLISKGKWVGDGDWLLAAAIGLALGHPWLALIALLIANLAATLVSAPAVFKSKNRPGSHQIYLGPFLVFAYVIVQTFAHFFISMI